MDDDTRQSVLLLGDTHLGNASRLPAEVIARASVADHVLHTGDVSALEVLSVLAQCAPVTAVRGNVEEFEVSDALPERREVLVGGVRIGMVHDGGLAGGRPERLGGWFPGCALIAYGHSHMPEVVRTSRGVWIVNPGSPTQRRRAPTHTVAWIELGGGAVRDVRILDI